MELLLNSEKVSKRYFYPRYASFEQPYYIESGKNILACYYHKVKNPKKTIIHFHGNGEVVSDYFDFFLPQIEKLGCSILFAEYRQYGLSTGEAPSLVHDSNAKTLYGLANEPKKLKLFWDGDHNDIFFVNKKEYFDVLGEFIDEF